MIEADVVESAASPALTKNADFTLLWAGQFVSQMGDRLAMVAFPWLIYRSTGSAFSTGVILALSTLPYVFFGAFAGVLIDRLNKRAVMVASDLARAGLAAVVPLAASHSLPSVYVLGFLIAAATVFFDPCKMAILPDIVPGDRLLRANSLLATTETLTEIVGYGLAGFVLAWVSTTTAFWIDAMSFLVSAAALSLMRYRAPLRAAAERTARSVWRELREGLSFIRRDRGVLANTIMCTAVVAGAGASYPLTFLLAVKVLGAGAKGFGALEAALGLGYFAGSIGTAALARHVRKGLAITVGLAVMGVAYVLVAAAGEVWQAALPLVLAGIANAAALIAVDTYLQKAVPEPLRGRVWGARFALTQGVFALSVIITGALAGVFDVRALFIVAGVLIAGPALAGLFVREIRDA